MIGIVTPYGRNEVTAAALRLADLAIAQGHDVHLIAAGVHERRLSPFWDHRVVADKQHSRYLALKGASTVVYFTNDRKALKAGQLVAGTAKHVLVPDWYALDRTQLAGMHEYSWIICPTASCKDAISAQTKVTDKQLSWCVWDSGLPSIQRSGLVDRKPRMLLYCDNSAIDYCAGFVLVLTRDLLLRHPTLSLTLLSVKSWPEREHQAARKLLKEFGGRLEWRRSNGPDDTLQAFHRHDWTVLPGVKYPFGITAMRSLSCGTPVIGYDMPALNETILNGTSGLLVTCELRIDAAGAPIAMADMTELLGACDEALSGSALTTMRKLNWELDKRTAAFDKFWGAVFCA